MGIFRQFPYSNFHEMNMDEIIKIVKNMLEEWSQYHAEWDAWMAEINDDWSNYQEVMNEAWQNMQDFINNYFDNLDVQNEINNKITSMVQSGEFSQIVYPYVPPAVAEWLAEHITTPETVVIDDSLSIEGAAADAKATGDAINDLTDTVSGDIALLFTGNGVLSKGACKLQFEQTLTDRVYNAGSAVIGYAPTSQVISNAYTLKIPCHNIESITYPTFKSTSNLGCIFVGSDGKVIQGIVQTEDVTAGTPKTIDVPTRADWFGLSIVPSIESTSWSVTLDTGVDCITEIKDARSNYESLSERLDVYDEVAENVNVLYDDTDTLEGQINAIADIIVHENLFNISTASDGYSLTNSGERLSNADYSVSDYIKLPSNETINISCNVSIGNQNLKVCYYDSHKANIADTYQSLQFGISGTYANNTLAQLIIPENARYLRFHYLTESVTKQFIGTWDVPSSYEYVTYGKHYIVTDTYEEKLKKLEYWGDSLSQGNQDSTGVSRASVIKTLLGNDWEVKNFGVGGEGANAVTARASGIFAIITPGVTIPADGTAIDLTGHLIDIFGNTIDFKSGIYSNSYASWQTVNPCYVNGVECILQRTDGTSPITIKRAETGDAISINRPSYIKMNSQTLEKGKVLLICIGQNEGFERDADQLICQIDGIISSRKADRFIVFGMPHALYGYTWEAPINAKLKTKYGRNYYDIEEYMKTPIYSGDTIISSYALQDAGLTPTETDLTAIGDNKYPPSIMYDEVHFNQYGYTVWANREYKIGQWLGYW